MFGKPNANADLTVTPKKSCTDLSQGGCSNGVLRDGAEYCGDGTPQVLFHDLERLGVWE